MKKEIPATSIQIHAFMQCDRILNKKVERCIKARVFYQKLQAQINKNRDKNQVFPCSKCGRVFDIIHKRSAHMNLHIKQAKRLKQGVPQQQKKVPEKRKYIKKGTKQVKVKEADKKQQENVQNQKQLVDIIFEGCD